MKTRTCMIAWMALAGWVPFAMAAEKSAHIGYVYPAGGRQGTSVVVKIGGENVYGTKIALVSGTGVTAEILDSKDPNEGQLDPKKKNKKKNEAVIDEIITVKLTIAPDAVPGDRDLCLSTPKMMSNKLIFQVGEMTEVSEKEPNNKIKVATPIAALPALVQGQIMPGDVDWYRFSAKKGQRLVVEVAARELMPYIADGVPGWFQAIVSVTDAAGKEVAVADQFRFSQDPVLFYEVPRDGEYGLSIHDTIYRGREDFVYRIRIGELPFITSVFPLGARVSTNPVCVKLSGVNLPVESLMVPVDSMAPPCRPISVITNGLHSNTRLFAVSDLPGLTELHPALKERRAKVMALPVIINSVLAKAGEKHYYRFEGKQGQSIRLEIAARRLGSPLDSCVVLLDSHGKKIAENDDVKDKGEGYLTHQSDSALTCVLPADGVYTVLVYDTQGGGGEEFAYRLRMSQPVPDFELRVTPAAVSLPQGGSASLTVYVIRKDGFDGEVKLSLVDPVNGVSLDAPRIPPRMDSIMTTVSSTGKASGRVAPRILGTAVVAGKTVTRQAVPAENLMQAFLYQHLFPFHEETVLVSQPPAPFHVVPVLPASGVLTMVMGQETNLTVKATRRPGFNGPIRLQFLDAPKGISFRNATIPPRKDTVSVSVRVESKVETNRQGNLVFTGSMPVEREATAEERSMMAAKAAREAEARRAVAAGTTNAPGVKIVSTNAPAPVPAPAAPASTGPVMVTRPVVLTFPAIPFCLVEKPVRKTPDAKPDKPVPKPDQPRK